MLLWAPLVAGVACGGTRETTGSGNAGTGSSNLAASSGAAGAGAASGSSSGATSSGASSSGATSSGEASTGEVGSGASSSGAGSGDIASSGTGGSSGSASGGSGSAALDGGAIWSPSAAAPIHFHWMIGGFTTADILPNQAGQVVYDIDGEGSTASDVAAIHAKGAIAVCYVDVGTLEQGRSDYNEFPTSVVGPGVVGWPGENWLLVTAANQSVILPLMNSRLTHWCQGKGFDAVEPDNLDAWTNITGVSETDNLAYDLAIAGLGHSLSLSVGLKNTLPDASASNQAVMAPAFDWALVEQCYEYSECTPYGQFISAGKAVWDVEYNVSPNCAQADMAHLNAQLRDLNLAGPHDNGYKYTPCVPDSQATW